MGLRPPMMMHRPIIATPGATTGGAAAAAAAAGVQMRQLSASMTQQGAPTAATASPQGVALGTTAFTPQLAQQQVMFVDPQYFQQQQQQLIHQQQQLFAYNQQAMLVNQLM